MAASEQAAPEIIDLVSSPADKSTVASAVQSSPPATQMQPSSLPKSKNGPVAPARVSMSPQPAAAALHQRKTEPGQSLAETHQTNTKKRTAGTTSKCHDTTKRLRNTRHSGTSTSETTNVIPVCHFCDCQHNDEEDTNYAQKIWAIKLNIEGWKHCNGDELHNRGFIPPKIISKMKVKEVKTKGTRGVHFIMGYSGLKEYLLKYGIDREPKDTNDFPEPLPQKACLKSIYESIEREQESLKEKAAKKSEPKDPESTKLGDGAGAGGSTEPVIPGADTSSTTGLPMHNASNKRKPNDASYAAPVRNVATRHSNQGGANSEMYGNKFKKMAMRILSQHLCPVKSWKSSTNAGELHSRMIYPGSLAGTHSDAHIRNKGNEGVHFVYDYVELGKMIEKYGLDYAPLLEDVPQELPASERKSLAEIHCMLFGKDKDGTSDEVVKKPESNDPESTKQVDGAGADGSTEPVIPGADTSSMTVLERTMHTVSNKRNADDMAPASNSSPKEGNKKKTKAASSNSEASARSVSPSSGENPVVSEHTGVLAGEPPLTAQQHQQKKGRPAENPTHVTNAPGEIQKHFTAIAKAFSEYQRANEELTAEKEQSAKVTANLKETAKNLSLEINQLQDKNSMMDKKCASLRTDNELKGLNINQLQEEKSRMEKECASLRTNNELKDLNISQLQDKYSSMEKKCETDNELKAAGIKRFRDKSDRLKRELDKCKEDCTAKDEEIRALKDENKTLAKERDESKRRVNYLFRQLSPNNAIQQRQHAALPSDTPNVNGRDTMQRVRTNVEETGESEDSNNEIPEELRGLDKDLIDTIKNEIVDSGEKVQFDDIAGLQNAKDTVNELIILPMKRPDLFTGLRSVPKGMLLFGPPGTGKTLIGKAIAHECGATFFSISSADLTSKWVGEGEKLVKTLFAVASSRAPSVIFIDEVDSLLTQRKADEDDSSRKMKTQFLIELDGAKNERKGQVLVVGATNVPEELDDAARRRFVKKLYIPLPDQASRASLIKKLLTKNETKHALTEKEILIIAQDTEGFSGADVKNLCVDAAMGPLRRLNEKEKMNIAADDLPAITYEHFRSSLQGMSPTVSKDDLAAYEEWNNTYGNKVTGVDGSSDRGTGDENESTSLA